MNPARMREMCPDAVFRGPVVLKSHRLLFDGQSRDRPGATANITHAQGQEVCGALFAISMSDLRALDQFENYPISYQRKEVLVYRTDGVQIGLALTYYRVGEPEGKPGSSYFEEMLEGARESRLPALYVQELEERVRSAGLAD